MLPFNLPSSKCAVCDMVTRHTARVCMCFYVYLCVFDSIESEEQLQLENNKTFLPSTIDELQSNSKYIVSEPDFVEVTTKSVLYADAKGAYPIFVMPGFRPNVMQTLYNNLGYPTFEARYPAKFDSIKTIAAALVKVRASLFRSLWPSFRRV